MDDQKRKLECEYGRLYDEIVRILYRHDPIGIGMATDGPPNEYEPEAGSIIPRLKGVSTVAELSAILREEFIWWFDQDLAGPMETYVPIAEEILAAMRKHT
ncbi:MAG: hypothetical protein HYY29_00805, partial [Chloroflexi bacterium]|nr:hypothetical protein [Chloroflexota bacterium]